MRIRGTVHMEKPTGTVLMQKPTGTVHMEKPTGTQLFTQFHTIYVT
jgi:hypothetical protein